MSQLPDADLAGFFAETLLEWAKTAVRPLPWKGSRNPYHIWLSEILLQQTRVEQGLPYFERFVAAYPTIVDLAEAPEDAVFKLWQGLGYYSRARNLHFTAKYIAQQYGGTFPNQYDQIRALKGVGDYTAAAIASFGFGLPYAVVDGNVYRVLSRFFGIATPIDSTEGKKQFAALAQSLLDTTDPARYNQAIMDFGAIHCKPQQPLCAECLHRARCKAFAEDKVGEYPRKSPAKGKRTRYFTYFVFQLGDQVALRKRTAKDIWQDLYDFPLLEPDAPSELADWRGFVEDFGGDLPDAAFRLAATERQTLSHQQIQAVFVEVECPDAFEIPTDLGWFWVQTEDVQRYAVPKLVQAYWDSRKNRPLTLF